jgi:hypothetical protein
MIIITHSECAFILALFIQKAKRMRRIPVSCDLSGSATFYPVNGRILKKLTIKCVFFIFFTSSHSKKNLHGPQSKVPIILVTF